jgi:tetratricopeptide (TPR) repeat protein
MNAILRFRRTLQAVAVTAAVLSLAGPASADLRAARTALAAGQLDAAVREYEKAAAEGYAEGRAGLGLVHLRRHQLDQALEQFQLAQRMDDKLALAWFGQGEVSRQRGDCAAAVPLLQRATELDRKFPEAQLALGECLVEVRQHDRAVATFNAGLNWGPKWRPRFLVALGQAELARDSLRDAGIWLTQAQNEFPDEPITNRALGELYLKRGIGELAVQSLERAVALDSADIELRHGLGQALYGAQRYNEALEQFKQVAARDPEFAPGQFSLGNLYYLSGQADPRRYADARPFLEKFVQQRPSDARGWSVHGRNLYFLRERDAALVALEKARDLGDKSKEMHRILARAYVDKREWQKALDAYALADLEPSDLFRMAQVHAILGNTERADSVYAAMIERDSTSGEARTAFVEWGKLKYRMKDHAGAGALFARRNALDPPSDEALYYAGLSFMELKQLPDAVSSLRRATEVAPAKGDRWFWLGMALSRADSTEAAEAAFEKTAEVDPSGRNTAIALQQIGYRKLLRKDWAGAVAALERSAVIDDKSVQTFVWLAQAHQNAGDRTRAIETYRKVLALQPGQADAVKGLKSLGA